MNKNFLLIAPIGAGVGTAICNGFFSGFSHLDWYRVFFVMIVTFVIELPIAFFSRKKK